MASQEPTAGSLGMRSSNNDKHASSDSNHHESIPRNGTLTMAAVPQSTLSWLYGVLTKVRPPMLQCKSTTTLR